MNDYAYINTALRVLCGKATATEKRQFMQHLLRNDVHLMWFADERKAYQEWIQAGNTSEEYWKFSQYGRTK